MNDVAIMIDSHANKEFDMALRSNLCQTKLYEYLLIRSLFS